MKLSTRLDVMKPSAIRETGKQIAARPGCISFAAGLPSPQLIPVEKVRTITDKILREQGATALQYGPTKGYAPLIEKIVQIMKEKNVDVTSENIQITTGSQQAISFSAMMFVDKGDTIITENPSYLGALAAFMPFECNFKGIDVDENGMKMDELEEVLKNDNKVKMIYVVPNFSNPTGRTWSLERRKRLLEIASKYDVPIIEDNPYGEIRFEGEDLPTIKSMDKDNRVIYLGSFSKVFCAGLRVGWICGEKDIISKYEMIKQGADLQSNQLSQMQVDEFINQYDMKAQIQEIIDAYKIKRDLMCGLIDEKFPETIKRTNPEGGMFVWLDLPEGADATELLKKALELNVGFVPGGPFYPNGGHDNTIRLNYSNMSEEQIVEGIGLLGYLFNKEF